MLLGATNLVCVFHSQIREDIHHHGIHIYPSAYPHEDDEDAQASAKYEVSCAHLTPRPWMYVHPCVICRP